MRLTLREGSHVAVDLRAAGLLRGFGHSPTLVARPTPFAVDLATDGEAPHEGGADDGGALVEASFPVGAIELPADMPGADRGKMRQNMLSGDVLDADHFPEVALRARYRGKLDGGTLQGELVVRGVPRPMSMRVTVSREGDTYLVRGSWEARLTELGIKPFRALLGTLKLQDWIRLRLDARFAPEA